MSDGNRKLGRPGTFTWNQSESELWPEPTSERIWQGEPHEAQAITVDVSALFPVAQAGDQEKA